LPPLKVIDKDLKKEHQKIQKQFQQLEEKIALLNQQKIKLETALASHDIYTDKNKFVQTETDYQTVSSDLQKANAEYENVFEKLMELENKIEQ
jgi:ATP-binding cassette subfamily F protein 3